ncbi:UNVERIFIED_CONTAM: hypothetical protein GTU68_013786 [Idotea baltica]|nr:hypothetical protein [Idotea baltica]
MLSDCTHILSTKKLYAVELCATCMMRTTNLRWVTLSRSLLVSRTQRPSVGNFQKSSTVSMRLLVKSPATKKQCKLLVKMQLV